MSKKLMSTFTTREGGFLEFFYDSYNNMVVHRFIQNVDNNIPSATRANYNRLNTFFSQAASQATKKMREGGFSYDEMYIDVSVKNKENGEFSYIYKIETFKNKNKPDVSFLVTDSGEVVVKSTNGVDYISKNINFYPQEVVDKINFLKEYFSSKTSEMEYLENIFKGNFTELGDPAM